MDEEYDVIVLGTGLTVRHDQPPGTRSLTVLRSIEGISEAKLTTLCRGWVHGFYLTLQKDRHFKAVNDIFTEADAVCALLHKNNNVIIK